MRSISLFVVPLSLLIAATAVAAPMPPLPLPPGIGRPVAPPSPSAPVAVRAAAAPTTGRMQSAPAIAIRVPAGKTPPVTLPGPSHPFAGKVVNVVELTRGPAASPADTLQQLYRDPFLAKLGPKMKLESYLRPPAAGKPFDATEFRKAGVAAITELMAGPDAKETIRLLEAHSGSQARHLLLEKLTVIEMALGAGPTASHPPLVRQPSLGHTSFPELFGEDNTAPVQLEAVPGARVINVSHREPIGGARSVGGHAAQAAAAANLYGRQMVPAERDANGDVLPAMSYQEVGRAVVGPEVRRADNHILTEDVMKGGGPTKFANNRFNKKATGTFTMQEAHDDWRNSEILRRGGVAVYEPMAVVMLPYFEWHDQKGWKPIGNYVRRPNENLRLSELEQMTTDQKHLVVSRLREKIQQFVDSKGGHREVTDADVVPFLVERLGRTAGLFAGGGFGGRPYLHGMLHDQNVSMMGEIVDIGKNPGVLPDAAAYRRAFSNTVYSRWIGLSTTKGYYERYADLRGKADVTEADILLGMAKRFSAELSGVLGQGAMSPAAVEQHFLRASVEGQRGIAANDPATALKRFVAAN